MAIVACVVLAWALLRSARRRSLNSAFAREPPGSPPPLRRARMAPV